MDALVGLASLSAREGDLKQAVELLALARHHPATAQPTRDRIQGLLAELGSELSPELLAAATALGEALGVGDVAAEILADYRRSEPISSRTAATMSSS